MKKYFVSGVALCKTSGKRMNISDVVERKSISRLGDIHDIQDYLSKSIGKVYREYPICTLVNFKELPADNEDYSLKWVNLYKQAARAMTSDKFSNWILGVGAQGTDEQRYKKGVAIWEMFANGGYVEVNENDA